MEKILIINKCEACKHLMHIQSHGYYICGKTDELLHDDIHIINKSCPLSDVTADTGHGKQLVIDSCGDCNHTVHFKNQGYYICGETKEMLYCNLRIIHELCPLSDVMSNTDKP